MSSLSGFGRLYRGETTINFYGRRRVGFVFSGALLVVTVGSLFLQGLNLGIDFKGGVSWEAPVTKTLDTAAINKAIDAAARPITLRPLLEPGVAAPSERRAPRALEVHIDPAAIGCDVLAEQQCPTVAEARRVVAELVAGVRHGAWLRAVRYVEAEQLSHAGLTAQRGGVESEFFREVVVQGEQAR